MAKWVAKTKAQYRKAVQEMTKQIRLQMSKLQFESAAEFYAFCLNALAYSVENAPVEFGDLRGTAYLEMNGQVYAMGDGSSLSTISGSLINVDIHARIVFPMEYALYQHEHWEFEHPLGGQAFYLEIGVAQAAKEFAQRMAEIAFG